jgi:hypothetical protein
VYAGDSWRIVGVNQTDDNKRSDHGEHRHPETAAKKTDSRSHGSPANRAHNQRIRVSDRRMRQQHKTGQGDLERRHQKYSTPVRLQGREHTEHGRYAYVAAQAKRGPRPSAPNNDGAKMAYRLPQKPFTWKLQGSASPLGSTTCSSPASCGLVQLLWG